MWIEFTFLDINMPTPHYFVSFLYVYNNNCCQFVESPYTDYVSLYSIAILLFNEEVNSIIIWFFTLHMIFLDCNKCWVLFYLLLNIQQNIIRMWGLSSTANLSSGQFFNPEEYLVEGSRMMSCFKHERSFKEFAIQMRKRKPALEFELKYLLKMPEGEWHLHYTWK